MHIPRHGVDIDVVMRVGRIGGWDHAAPATLLARTSPHRHPDARRRDA
jgi:hypothetical protein